MVEEGGAPGAGPEALSITQLFSQVERTLKGAFGDELWITGEIRQLKVLAKGHCFIDLVDPNNSEGQYAPVLNVKCWSGQWRAVRNKLADLGIELEAGMVVRVRGELSFYKARGTVDFTMSALDTDALLGKVAAERARLIKALVDEGLFDRQKRLMVPALPLRIGLVASPGTEGCNDFLGQLAASGMAFDVSLVRSAVQGADAPGQIARAIATLQRSPVDVIVLVRGGGSKADLATFDTETVVRAVATSGIPVMTGIGHTGDRSLADEVAFRSFITPTECGQEIGRMVVDVWADRVLRGRRLAGLALDRLDRAERAVDQRRTRAGIGARSLLERHADRLDQRKARLIELSERRLGDEGVRLEQWRRLLEAYDYRRQLERGYSVTRTAEGQVVRSASQVEVGSALITVVADGVVHSTATTSTALSDAANLSASGDRSSEQGVAS